MILYGRRWSSLQLAGRLLASHRLKRTVGQRLARLAGLDSGELARALSARSGAGMSAGAMNGPAVQQTGDRPVKEDICGFSCSDISDIRLLIDYRVPPVIKPRSEPTNFGKATGHGSVNQPLESLVLRSKSPGCVNITGIFASCISAVDLRTVYVRSIRSRVRSGRNPRSSEAGEWERWVRKAICSIWARRSSRT